MTALNELISATDGSPLVELPGPGQTATVTRFELYNHPFLVATDVFVFAGPDEALAARRYLQGLELNHLNVTAWAIHGTDAIQRATEGQPDNQGDATIHLTRVL